METVVFQSYRTTSVAPWIARCMESVRAWAALNDFEYRFVDDRLFDYAPPWYRQKVANNVLLVSDLARVKLARELLASGYRRAVWVDADFLMFDPRPAAFKLPHGYAFCREVWAWREPDGRPALPEERVNNSVSVFEAGNPMLEFFAHALESAVANSPGPASPVTSTALLTELNRRIGLPQLRHMGTLSPYALAALMHGDDAFVSPYMAKVGEPLVGANLCGSFGDAKIHGSMLEPAIFERAAALLLETRGAALNRFLGAPAAA
jgi:hypothetical protein